MWWSGTCCIMGCEDIDVMCCCRPLVLRTTRLWCLTCTVPAAAWPDAPEGASSCDPLNCSCWWLRNRSCNTCRTQRDDMKRSSNTMFLRLQPSIAASLYSGLVMMVSWISNVHQYRDKYQYPEFIIEVYEHPGAFLHLLNIQCPPVWWGNVSFAPLSWQHCCKDTAASAV